MGLRAVGCIRLVPAHTPAPMGHGGVVEPLAAQRGGRSGCVASQGVPVGVFRRDVPLRKGNLFAAEWSNDQM